jgi:hypothetical protein
MSALPIKLLQDREIQAAQHAGEEFFLGLPDAWYDPAPTYGCNNGHVSRRYLKSEDRGCLCLECHEGVAMLPHKYSTDEVLSAALADVAASHGQEVKS